MKKLYAKTSFTNKNRLTKSNHKDDNETLSNSSSAKGETYKYQHPIFAYQTTGTTMTKISKNSHMKYAPKHPFVNKLHEVDATAVALDSSVGIYNNESSYYYTLTELENLHMLDHRHPHFHHLQKMQQLQQSSPNNTTNSTNNNNNTVNQVQYHQYNQLVMKLPAASAVTSDDVIDGLQQQQQKQYEAPQNNSHQQQHYYNNQHSLNKANRDASSDATKISLVSQASSATPPPQHSISLNCATTRTPSTSELSAVSKPVDVYNVNKNCNINQNQPQLSLLSLSSTLSQSSATSESSATFSSSSSKADFVTGTSTLLSPAYSEQSIIGARASVMVYDDNQKKWVPSGTSSGLSKVQIYHHQQNNTFRVVGRKLQDHEVVINCSILKGLKYNQATATFHQWRDSKNVYGLNFSSQNDAEAFARAMMHALDILSGRVPNNPGQPTNGNGYEEDMGYRTMTSEDAAILRQQQQITGQVTPSAQTPTSQTNQNNIPQSPPTPQQSHHRTSRNSLSAPPAPQPQQQMLQQHQQQQALYGHTAGNGPTQNGGMLQQQQQQQQQQQPAQLIQPPPIPGQTQYHTPQLQQQQHNQQQQQQQQQQPSQHQQPQQHSVYASQQMANAAAYLPQPNQYQQSHYILSNSNPNLNMHQYSQQQPGIMASNVSQPPLPPPHQNQNGVGSIYVSSQQQLGPGIPNSQSSNSVVYASQTQLGGSGIPMPPQPPQPPAMPPNGPPVTSNAYGQMNGGSQVQQQLENPYGQVPTASAMMTQQSSATVSNVSVAPTLNRMSSTGGSQSGGAPITGAPAPPPPPTFGGAASQMFSNNTNSVSGPAAPSPPQPPAPPAPPAMAGMGSAGGTAAPPPPPPPPMGGIANKKDDCQADLMGSLAAQLQQAKLKKKSTPAPTENSGSSTPSGGSGNYGTIGRSTNGMASMMDEMAKTLARRRAQAERKEPEPEPEVKQRPWEKSNTLPHKLGNSNSSNLNTNSSNTSNSGGESPRPMRKRFGSASEETILKQVNGESLSVALSGGDLDQLKAEIVKEMKQEIHKVKQEIIDAIKSEFNRR